MRSAFVFIAQLRRFTYFFDINTFSKTTWKYISARTIGCLLYFSQFYLDFSQSFRTVWKYLIEGQNGKAIFTRKLVGIFERWLCGRVKEGEFFKSLKFA